jgi:Holliday junction resolvase RusA-like endonuclease
MTTMAKKTSKPEPIAKTVIKQAASRVEVALFCVPVPASRPRVTRWGTYYLKTYDNYRKQAHAAIPQSRLPPLEGVLHADVEFICKRPVKITLDTPRGDIDNHLKSIFDAITGEVNKKKGLTGNGYWIDDAQVGSCTAGKRYAEPNEEPHTRIVITKT